jgi:predicted TIM-barrel fold metal-dependent hydrolase
VAELLQCDAVEETILARREALGVDALTNLCFARGRLETVLLDDGLDTAACEPIEWHARFVGVQRVLRLEKLAQELFLETEDFDGFLDRFRGSLDPPPAGVVAFKSIAAYRSGLAIETVEPEEAAFRYCTLKSAVGSDEFRLVDKPLVDFLLFQAMEIAIKYTLPIQLHTGFGDTDLDLRLASPLHLRSVLENPSFRSVRLVLLHASYPYAREAGYLASVYPGVYVDFGLAVPYLSVSGMRRVLGALLELAPTSKLLYSSDAHGIPELYYLGAKWGREALGWVLDETVGEGDLSSREADDVAVAILRNNARALYGL